MNKYLPSKKFLYIIISVVVAIIIVLGIKALTDWRNSKNDQAEAEKSTLENKQKISYEQFMAIDTDKDGLKDWEEALWKTDPKNPDTDSDGTSDGDEVKVNRDPLKPNTDKTGKKPTDQIDEKIIADQKKQESDFLSLSMTDQLSHTLFSQYLSAKGSGPISAADKKIILDTTAGAINNAQVPTYSGSNLIITNDLSSTTVRKYGNDLGQAFFAGGTNQENIESDVVVLSKLSKNVDAKTLAELDPTIESYTKTIAKILLITVPVDAADIHLNFLNDLLSIKDGLTRIKSLMTDPAQAMVGLREYKNGSANLTKDLVAIKSYFLSHKVTFTNSEYGYLWLNII